MAEMTSDQIAAVKSEALREAAHDFRRAAAAGVEPALNQLAAQLLHRRADKIDSQRRRLRWAAPKSLDSGLPHG